MKMQPVIRCSQHLPGLSEGILTYMDRWQCCNS